MPNTGAPVKNFVNRFFNSLDITMMYVDVYRKTDSYFQPPALKHNCILSDYFFCSPLPQFSMNHSEHLGIHLPEMVEDIAACKICSRYLLRTHKGFLLACFLSFFFPMPIAPSSSLL